MMRIYWLVAALFTAIAVHAAVILLTPAYSFGVDLKRISADAGTNALFILPQEAQARLFPAYPRQSVIGVCAFDVSASNVALSAEMPQGFWTLTIYSERGNVIYSVNDQQAGTNSFTVGLSLAPGFLETLQQVADKEVVAEDSGWTVKSPEPRGLAILWFPATEAAARDGLIKQIAASTCKAAT